MASMSGIEQGFCRSAPWRGLARKVIVPWALAGFQPQGQLLELGAGSGAMAEGTARTFPDLQLTVTDIDPAMVAAARKSLGTCANVRVERADAADLPFADNTFNVVTSYLMLHHVVEWRQHSARCHGCSAPAVLSSATTSTKHAWPHGYTSWTGRRTACSNTTSGDPRWRPGSARSALAAGAGPARHAVQGSQVRELGDLMLSLTCRSCNETMQAETEDEMVDLGLEHARKHGHTPPSRTHPRSDPPRQQLG